MKSKDILFFILALLVYGAMYIKLAVAKFYVNDNDSGCFFILSAVWISVIFQKNLSNLKLVKVLNCITGCITLCSLFYITFIEEQIGGGEFNTCFAAFIIGIISYLVLTLSYLKKIKERKEN